MSTTRKPWLRDGSLLVALAFIGASVAAVAATVAVAVAFAVAAALRGARAPAEFQAAAQSPWAIWATLIASQSAILLVALLACRAAGAAPRDRLGLVPPRVGRRDAAILVVGTLVPFCLGLLAAALMPSLGGNEAFESMWSSASRPMSALWVLTIAIVPGVVEELFYRGFVQRSLLQRLRPRSAILVSSALFALMHVDPPAMAFTFALGIWLGIVSWRSGSVMLPILIHVGVNGGWTTLQMVLHRTTLDGPVAAVLASIAIVPGFVAFALAIPLLVRPRPVEPAAAGPSPGWRARPALAVVAGGVVLAAALLVTMLPDPVGPPNEASLRERVSSRISCSNAGETAFELPRGGVVLLELPANRPAIHELLISLDESGETVWLGYEGAVSGKKAGRGIVEQLRSGDPTAVVIELDAVDSGLTARLEIVQEQAALDESMARAQSEGAWAIRGRG